jgi:vacuolar-type H+-ATPase subunit E/Vma4
MFKNKVSFVLFAVVSVVLLVSIIVISILPNAGTREQKQTENDTSSSKSNDSSSSTTSERLSESNPSNQDQETGSDNTSSNDEIEKAISNFLTVWYTKKDRNEIEKIIGNKMTDQLYEKYFGTESMPTPSNEGDPENVVQYEKNLNTLDVYVKKAEEGYKALYEAETTFTIGENDTSQRVIGKVIVINEEGKWLVDGFEELDVQAK